MAALQFHSRNQREVFDQSFLAKCGREKETSYGETQDYNGNYRSISLVAPGTDLKKVETAIQQMRIAVSDCKLNDYSDEYLMKWLSMQDFNVVRAEKSLRQSLEWRRLNRIDEILDIYTPSEVLKKYYSFTQFGIDKYGCPVFFSAAGNVDVHGLVMSTSKGEYFDFIRWMEETCDRATKETSERTGKQVTTSTLIIDFEHLSMKKVASKTTMQLFLEAAKLRVFHYPMNNRRVFIINAPKKCFQLMLAMLKPFVPQSALLPMRVYGSDRNEWTAALLEEIDADQIPAYYGGTLTDPDGDPKCSSIYNMGGEVPKSYYLSSNNGPAAKDYMETMVIIAGAGGKKKMKYKVDVPFSVLRWEFMTEGGDIRFRVYTKNSKGSTNELIPLCRVDSHLAMEEGQMICDEPGKYVFEFDNTFSYLRTKKLHYHIFIDQP